MPLPLIWQPLFWNKPTDCKRWFAAMKTFALLFCLAASASMPAQESLRSALTFHASFDSGLDADFSLGDKACQVKKGGALVSCLPNDEVKLDAEGRFGGCVFYPKKGVTRPQFSGVDVLGYNDRDWSATVSVWLRLTPDEDLEPGYCDPVQIVGDDGKKGFIFLEWSKNETPRFFRYAIRPLVEIWNPGNLQWDEIPFEKRPMVQLSKAPFSRDAWTHVAFTLSHVNNSQKKPSGTLYINGSRKGAIEGWDLRFGWKPESVALVLGASFVGRQDDLAVFNRALGDAEVNQLYNLEGGVGGLRK